MTWRLAKSLEVLRAQVDKLAPERSRLDDGTIGDEAHSSRLSDHNPNKAGVVCALDLTHDPHGGFDSYAFADMLKMNHDVRLKYVISNSRIWNPTVSGKWRPYHGINPHDKHVHISVRADASHYDSDLPWILATLPPPDPSATPVDDKPVLREGSTGADVKYLQKLLGIAQDGDFGPATTRSVKAFQKAAHLFVDGVVGRYTWQALLLHPPQAPVVVPEWSPGYKIGNVTASVFGGSVDAGREKSAYDGHTIGDAEPVVALPWHFAGVRPKVKVTNPKTGSWSVASIEDVGPWNTDDPYWQFNNRPQAETGTDHRGRRTNHAGIDLSPALARAVGISGMGRVDWEFVV